MDTDGKEHKVGKSSHQTEGKASDAKHEGKSSPTRLRPSEEEAVSGKGQGDILTAKEIKNKARPNKFYPTATLKQLGFTRHKCPKCANFYWRHTEERKTCGDSQCEQKYSFIGTGTGIGRGPTGKKLTYADAWKGFERSFTSARKPCTSIARYPVVARWRADVDYVAAGIYCFQFCLRFNDLDNIGLTGRHYSGFIMLGIQVFNKPDARKFWSDECLEFNYRWLTEELGIHPDEITFIEDVWAGGGNLGPSIEYFVGGLELGNMVFMQFKTFPDGRFEPLQVQVIDVGIGLERVPWLINGTPTSYVDVFPRTLKYLISKLHLDINQKMWDKYGPLSCLLNIDEVEDIEKTWASIGKELGLEPKLVKAAIEPIRDVYIVLDHTRTVLMAIEDGSLPSNAGGGSNVRDILRRVFALLSRNGWFDVIKMDGLMEIFQHHRDDLATIYGPFKEYPSFRPIIELEYDRWLLNDKVQQKELEKHVAKVAKAGRPWQLNDWITCIRTYGCPAETISRIVQCDIPGNLWSTIAETRERDVQQQDAVLYNTAHLPPTVSLYYHERLAYQFEGKITAVFPNAINLRPNVVILDQSSFYPTSGGQEHDLGELMIKGQMYKVVDVQKVGPTVLHFVEPDLPMGAAGFDEWTNVAVCGQVDQERRNQLTTHHTATHIVFAACRTVLGPHIWQAGAKKSTHKAHLDITHYQGIPRNKLIEIENEANRVVRRSKPITKTFMSKDGAERQFGFALYQGGVVPGNELRVVHIADTDTEACCGTHCDNTAAVGLIKILKASRISDGIVRLEYVAGENALRANNALTMLVDDLMADWGVEQKDGYKKYQAMSRTTGLKVLSLQIRNLLLDGDQQHLVSWSDESNPSLLMGSLPDYAEELKAAKKSAVFLGRDWIYGILGDPSVIDEKDLGRALAPDPTAKDSVRQDSGALKTAKMTVKRQVITVARDKKDKRTTADVLLVQATSVTDTSAVLHYLKTKGFKD